MTHVISSLCVRDGGCVTKCPVDCIVPGQPQDEWPIYYIDPNTCIDCGACIPECPVRAIFTIHDVPKHFIAQGGEILTGRSDEPGFDSAIDLFDYQGNPVHLPAVRILQSGETIDLTKDIQVNRDFFDLGPGYLAIDL